MDRNLLIQTVFFILYTGVFGLGLGVSVALARSMSIFSGCVLNCEMAVMTDVNGTVILDRNTIWGPTENCWYAVSIGIVAVVVAVIWFWFYALKSVPGYEVKSTTFRTM